MVLFQSAKPVAASRTPHCGGEDFRDEMGPPDGCADILGAAGKRLSNAHLVRVFGRSMRETARVHS
jgi:hypothetical protein